jgi:anion-transporting  ArsA/GET3 family ATPase
VDAEDSQASSVGVVRELLARRLVFVTGKGGTGKTTIAAVLGVAAASSGYRSIVCELGGAQQLPRVFGRSGDVGGEIALGDGLWVLAIDPRDALREWLRAQPGGALAVAVLTRSRAFEHFVAAAPGAKELVTVGKLGELSRRDRDAGGRARYDVVIADGPSTGHALAMLAAPRGVSEIAPVGPIGRQARELGDFLADPNSTAIVGVSLAEEMSLHEVLELEQGVRDALGRHLDLIVVNGVYPDRFTDADAQRLQATAQRVAPAGALDAVLAQHRQARVHAARIRWLRARTQTPVATLPFVFEREIGPPEYARFARELRDSCGQGFAR